MSQRSSDEQYLLPSTLSNIEPSQILPFLYVGCQEDALSRKTMQDNQITHVINVSTTGARASFLNENDDDEHFLRIPINDCLNAQLLPYFDQAYKFIEKARLNNGRIFIHCLAGISRSPALAIAYIIRYLHLSADDAYKYVKQRRSQISPNFNFLGQLYEYERSLSLKSNSTSTIIPIINFVTIESPLNDRRHFIQIENCCNTDNSIKHRTNVLTRPTCFNFDSISKRRPQTLLASSSSVTELSVELPEQQSLLTPKLLHSKDTLIKQSTIELINSSYDESMKNRRVEIASKSVEMSPSMEQSDLINTYLQESRMLSKSLEQWSHTQSLDLTSKTLTNVLSSSVEVLVL